MTVAFLFPALLIGALAVLLPVLVHLISRRRARRVQFAAMEFVLKSQRRSARTIRLRQLILLLTRALFLGVIALALARPVLRPDDTETNKTTDAPLVAVFVVDTSGSMSARLDGQTTLQRAKSKVREHVLDLPDDVFLALIACDDAPRDLVGPPTFDRSTLLRKLDALEETNLRGRLAPCVSHAVDVTKDVEGVGDRRVVIVSDLADHAFLGGEEVNAATGSVVVEWVRALDEEPPPNRGIVDASISRGHGGQASVEIGVKIFQSSGLSGDVSVDLVIDDARAARASVSLADGTFASKTFTHAFSSEAADTEGSARAPNDNAPLHRALVTLPDDALTADDVVEIPLDVPAPTRVLIVDGAPQPIPIHDEVFYIESALRHDGALNGRLEVTVVGPDALTPGALALPRVVILANTPPFDDDTARALVDYVRAGGGLLVTVGDNTDVEWMNRALSAVLPGRLRGTKGMALLDDAQIAEVLGFARFDLGHPALRPLAKDEGGLAGLARVETRTFMLLEPDRDAPRDVVIAFTNDAPALVERAVDAGRVMLLSTTIDRDWTDFPIRPGFLPLIQQVVLHLGRALDESGPRVVTAGDERRVFVPSDVDEVEVVTPRGKRAVVAVEDLNGQRLARFTDTGAVGLHQVAFKRKGGALHDVPSERFTVLFPGTEGDLRAADEDRIDALMPRGARRAKGRLDDDDTPLWPMLLVAGCILLVVEAAMVRRAAARGPGG